MRLQMTIAVFFVLYSLSHNALATGDCDNNGTVTISEVQSAINMFLGSKAAVACVDEDVSGSVSIAEVQKTINTFLGYTPANNAPVANAGTAQNVNTGSIVTLDGSGSSDANGDLLTYSWAFTSKPAGSIAALSGSTTVKPTFTVDVTGTFALNLVVNDGKINSVSSTVNVVSMAAKTPLTASLSSTGNVKIFTLLIDFNDYPHYNDVSNINSKIYGDGVISENPLPYESLKNYYSRSSYGKLTISGTALGWYRPAYSRASMPKTDAAANALIKEAITYYKNAGHDFSQYDNDNDGTIDNFVVIWTGPLGSTSDFWWESLRWVNDPVFTVDGKKLNTYTWIDENNNNANGSIFNPKALIHETGHALGLPDLYDQSASGPRGGVGGLDMMDADNGDHNPYSKWLLGWINPQIISSGSQTVTLRPFGNTGDAIVLMPNASANSPFNEYFIIQNRMRGVGNDPASYPADGLLIWHIDARLGQGGNFLYNNSDTDHKLVRLMEADGLEEIEKGNNANSGDYYTLGKIFSPSSSPSSFWYDGTPSGFTVSNIIANSDKLYTFDISYSQVNLNSLIISKAGTGSGTIVSLPANISCGATCSANFTTGTDVILTAASADNSIFTGWTGGGCSGSGSCRISMLSDVSVQAIFVPATIVSRETFDGGVLPNGWSVRDNAGSGAIWRFDNPNNNPNMAVSPNLTGGGSKFAEANVGYSSVPYKIDTELISPSYNLSSYSAAKIFFNMALQTDSVVSDVDVSYDGGITWTSVRFTATTSVVGPFTRQINVEARTNVRVRYHFYNTTSWITVGLWQIDNFTIYGAPL
jgi:M6 family metalloprotease-like protein